ncbi:hypothetical protein KSC_093680 [Ktedonobacter sp. SOSP1-52]|nr:hypothetical protein KSC_093680 [Ktedonobacter sp. SOSP1-52]
MRVGLLRITNFARFSPNEALSTLTPPVVMPCYLGQTQCKKVWGTHSGGRDDNCPFGLYRIGA